MVKKSVTIEWRSSKRDISLRGPSGFHEMTTGEYQAMVGGWDGADAVQLFSILYEADYETVMSSPANVEEAVAAGVAFVYREGPMLLELPLPKIFMGADVPEDVGELTLGQAIILRAHGDGKKEGEMISLAIALYMDNLVRGGKPDLKKALVLEEQIKAMPITQTFALGFFLLSQLAFSGRRPGKLSSLLTTLLTGLTTPRQRLPALRRLIAGLTTPSSRRTASTSPHWTRTW